MQARSQTLFDILRRSAARDPDKLAVCCGETRWSYAEFLATCETLAGGLHADGVTQGTKVAVLSRNSHAFVALRFALARLGAVLVPVNFMLTAQEVRYILEHAGATLLALDTEFSAVGREAAAGTAVGQFVWLPSEQPGPAPDGMTTFDALLARGRPAPEIDLPADALAQIVYTSGTESAPKGAMLTHDALLWEYSSCISGADIARDDLLLHALPLFHCAQLDVFFGPAMFIGASNVITAHPTPASLLRLLAAHRITSFFAPPTVWIGLLRTPEFDATDLSQLRKGYYGASIMPVEVMRELAQRLPHVRLWNLYGQTEVAPLATILGPDDQLRKPGSAGKPVLNVQTRVVDEDMQDVPVGEVGEIVHRSPHLMTGYFNAPDKTAAAFAGGWFHSGDLGRRDDDGYLYVVDRKKDMIKTGGENVASREVEEMLYLKPEVSEVAVIGLPHPQWIEAVVACVVLKAGASLQERDLIAHCEQHVARFKVPKRVVFLPALPKNPSGKLLKRELRKTYAELFSEGQPLA